MDFLGSCLINIVRYLFDTLPPLGKSMSDIFEDTRLSDKLFCLFFCVL
jgi:hypothetical protein